MKRALLIGPDLATDEFLAQVQHDPLAREFIPVLMDGAGVTRRRGSVAFLPGSQPEHLRRAGFEPAASWLVAHQSEAHLTQLPLCSWLWGVTIVPDRDPEAALRAVRAAWRVSRVFTDYRLAGEALASIRRKGGRIVMTNGVFDLPHLGHLRGLQAARDLGDALVVAINSDRSARECRPPGRPLLGQFARAEVVASWRPVDLVVIFAESAPTAVIGALQPDVLAKGKDYEVGQVIGAEVVTRYGGRVQVVPYLKGYGTSAIIQAARDTPRLPPPPEPD